MEEWPPKNYDYKPQMEKEGIRLVETKYWKIEPDVKDGLKKVFALPSFEGCYKDSEGHLYDLRPRDSCPCYETLKKKSIPELLGMLAKALKG
mmetsp:Transcript_33443/g.30439  ORF Transcript_33443/g.30439 Transcript_33443/m.30439 type:complete len:92 (+) Transcript_33443:219-494(+)